MASTRRLNSWLGGFHKYTEHMGVPQLFRKWAGVSAVSGALERRCVLHTVKGELSPNLFVLLVAPPGVGKSVIIGVVFNFWTRVAGLAVAPSSTTRAGLIDFMVDARRVDVSGPLPKIYHSVLCASSEFGNLVPQYDNAWLNILNDIYDCGPLFSDMTRKYGEVKLEHPHMVILAGTQPKYLDNLLPDAAFGMGFTSRLVMVYAGSTKYVSLFSNVKKNPMLDKYLLEDLTTISTLHGEFFLTPEAERLWEELAVSKFAPVPEHSKLQHYASRREVLMMKLMMVNSASERDDLRITEEHIEKSLALVHETEKVMPQIFQEMVTKGYADANEEVLSYITQNWRENGKKPMQETQIMRFLMGKVPNNQIKATIDLLVQSGALKMQLNASNPPYKTYTPVKT